MIPILYAKNASEFGNNGIGHLKDAISCKVTEERNGAYTLTLQYPIGGAWYESITEGSIIKAKANETSELQLFRVYKSSKPMKGVVTFYAEHISYDLKGLPLALLSMTDTTAEAALNAGFAACLLPHRFTGRSDITTLNKINITKPRSLRNFCGGEAGSVLSVWGGEFEFDNFTVWLHRRRGANNGVVIRYGKNLTDAKQERNISACYTHFCPYAIKKTETRNEAGEVIESTEETITLPEGVIELINPENIGHSRALPLDISDKFADGEELNVENLRTHAEEYIESHKLGVPDVNITLSFMQIWHSPEYAESAGFERVALCDTVTVFFEDLGINAEAKVIKTEYDTLEERFSKLEVGDAKSNLTDTVSGIKESIEDTKKSLTESEKAASLALQSAIENATNRITGNSGGYVVLYPANNPQEILVMDSDDKETATRVWRWNSSGLGYSKNGYNGTYGLAMTMDGEIVADFITAGTLKAINISGCTIEGGSLNINDKFTVDTEGNVHTEGYIVATGGIIGDCEIKDGKLVIGSANITGKLTAGQIDASELKVSAANITGSLTASQIDASELKVSAANITGSLTIGQLPSSVATTSDIPTNVSELNNDSDYQTESGVVSIVDGRITADYVEALGITVGAAQISGKLTASQIDASELKVSAANITGSLTIGQLPSSVATTSDIPTNVSELNNDSGYKTYNGVVSIIDGRITADYIEALEISVAAAQVTGKLTASQIDADGISASDVTISGEVTATSGSMENMTITGKLTFGGNSSYYINANYNDGSYYINLPGFKVDDASGAVFSGRLSAATGTFSGSLSAATGTFAGELSAAKGRLGDGIIIGTSGICTLSGYAAPGYSTVGMKLAFRDNTYLTLYSDRGGQCAKISADNYIYLETTNGRLGGTWVLMEGSETVTSDANTKNSICEISSNYGDLFDLLRPVIFKYNNGTSGRFHVGFIAQDVRDSILAAGLTTTDFAGFVEFATPEQGDGALCGLRYDEFIALNTYEIQKLKKRLSELESLIKAK